MEPREFSAVDISAGPPAAKQGAVSLLQDVKRSRRITMTFHLSAHVPVIAQGGGPTPGSEQQGNDKAGTEAAKEKQVLFDVKGCVEPGQILALMGPSGSGKSSLLTALGGRSTARITGDILFNGRRMSKAVKRSMGFVTQDDLLFAELTTYETLYYAAMLRLPRDWTPDMKRERVEMVIEGLGLTSCRNTPIGDHMTRGVSGGERKRVSIGHELLINPSVILLDEPTSGLDSTTALNLMTTLRLLASGGRAIIASIHQPSSRLYQEIDQLLLLSEGRTMYYGDAHISASWFQAHGAGVPFGVSIPDHILDLACGDLPNLSAEESKAMQRKLVDAYANRTIGRGPLGISPSDFPDALDGNSAPLALASPYHAKGTESSGDMDTSMSDAGGEAGAQRSLPLVTVKVDAADPAPLQHSVTGITVASGAEEGGSDGEGQHKWGATWWEQVRVLTSRCLRVRRHSALSVQTFSEVLIPALLAGLFWFQIGGTSTLTAQDVTDLSGLLFFQVLYNAYRAMFLSIFTFPADFAMLKKERASGMYRLTAYYAARAISDVPMECLIPTLFTIIVYFMAGLRLTAGAFFANLFSLLLTVLVSQSTGLLIGATVMNPRTAMAMCTVYMLTVMLISGYWVQNVPSWIAWLKYAAFLAYSYELQLKIEFGNRGYSCADYYLDNPDAPLGATWCPISEGGFFKINVDSAVTLQVLVLLLFLVVMRVAAYYALRHHTSFKVHTTSWTDRVLRMLPGRGARKHT